MTRSSFWVLQRTKRRAEQLDLMIVLVLTAVSLYSLLRVVVKVVHKLDEKVFRRFRNRRSQIQEERDEILTNAVQYQSEAEHLLND
jgi:hypothetical protein